jgi:hypothetical protein
VVYEAENATLHRFVALKFLPEEVAKKTSVGSLDSLELALRQEV